MGTEDKGAPQTADELARTSVPGVPPTLVVSTSSQATTSTLPQTAAPTKAPVPEPHDSSQRNTASSRKRKPSARKEVSDANSTANHATAATQGDRGQGEDTLTLPVAQRRKLRDASIDDDEILKDSGSASAQRRVTLRLTRPRSTPDKPHNPKPVPQPASNTSARPSSLSTPTTQNDTSWLSANGTAHVSRRVIVAKVQSKEQYSSTTGSPVPGSADEKSFDAAIQLLSSLRAEDDAVRAQLKVANAQIEGYRIVLEEKDAKVKELESKLAEMTQNLKAERTARLQAESREAEQRKRSETFGEHKQTFANALDRLHKVCSEEIDKLRDVMK